MPARKIGALDTPDASARRGGCHPIVDGDGARWHQLAMGEWSLLASGWADQHPFDEVNYVLEGHLLVECDGEVLEARAGETIQVFAGSEAHYHAPDFARMIYIYGANPDGKMSRQIGELPGPCCEPGHAPPIGGTNS